MTKSIEELRAELAAAEAAEKERLQKEREAQQEQERQKRIAAERKKLEDTKLQRNSILTAVAAWIENNSKLTCTVNVAINEHNNHLYSNIDVTDGEMKRNFAFGFNQMYSRHGVRRSETGREYVKLEGSNFIKTKASGYDTRRMAELICAVFDRAKLENAAAHRSAKAEQEKRKAVKHLRDQYQTGEDADWYWHDLGDNVKFSHSAAGAEISVTFTCRGDAEALIAFYNSFVKEGRITPRKKSNG